MGDGSVKKGPGNRALGVKAAILNHVLDSRHSGASTADVQRAIEAAIPTVSDNTVRSVLSRLKGDGALVYVETAIMPKSSGQNLKPTRR